MKFLLISGIRFYQLVLSAFIPPCCRFSPSCSQYAFEALQHRGIVMGSLLAAWRIVRCNPLSRGGYDPVPGANPGDCT